MSETASGVTSISAIFRVIFAPDVLENLLYRSRIDPRSDAFVDRLLQPRELTLVLTGSLDPRIAEFVRGGEAVRAGATFGQHGSASGRVRVGQYVSCSGVATTLQK